MTPCAYSSSSGWARARSGRESARWGCPRRAARGSSEARAVPWPRSTRRRRARIRRDTAPLVPEPRADARRAVCERRHFDAAACRAWHHTLPSRLGRHDPGPLGLVGDQPCSRRSCALPARAPGSPSGSARLRGQPCVLDALKIEPQAAAWASESDGAERVGMGVDPIALDAKHIRELGRVNEPRQRRRLRRCDQVGDLPGDPLDISGVEPHGREPTPARSSRCVLLAADRIDAAARRCGMGSLPVSRAASPPSKLVGLASVCGHGRCASPTGSGLSEPVGPCPTDCSPSAGRGGAVKQVVM